MAPRFIWGGEQVEAFFNILRGSYQDYLRAKELRRMDEFYDNIGACIGADGLIVQNFLKKTGRAYRDILLLAETSGEGAEKLPERKLRGSARVYRLYEEYYQMYYLGSVPLSLSSIADEAVSIQHKVNRLGGRKRKSCVLVDAQVLPEGSNKRLVQPAADIDTKDENEFLVVEEDADYAHADRELEPDHHVQVSDHNVTDHFDAEEVTEHIPHKRKMPGKQRRSSETVTNDTGRDTRRRPEEAATDGAFGKASDFQERFLKLMDNQNHILSNIVEELNLIRQAVLDANGLQTITYVK